MENELNIKKQLNEAWSQGRVTVTQAGDTFRIDFVKGTYVVWLGAPKYPQRVLHYDIAPDNDEEVLAGILRNGQLLIPYCSPNRQILEDVLTDLAKREADRKILMDGE